MNLSERIALARFDRATERMTESVDAATTAVERGDQDADDLLSAAETAIESYQDRRVALPISPDPLFVPWQGQYVRVRHGDSALTPTSPRHAASVPDTTTTTIAGLAEAIEHAWERRPASAEPTLEVRLEDGLVDAGWAFSNARGRRRGAMPMARSIHPWHRVEILDRTIRGEFALGARIEDLDAVSAVMVLRGRRQRYMVTESGSIDVRRLPGDRPRWFAYTLVLAIAVLLAVMLISERDLLWF